MRVRWNRGVAHAPLTYEITRRRQVIFGLFGCGACAHIFCLRLSVTVVSSLYQSQNLSSPPTVHGDSFPVWFSTQIFRFSRSDRVRHSVELRLVFSANWIHAADDEFEHMAGIA